MRRLLVANRGEISRRIFRTAKRLGWECVAVYSDGDRDAAFVHEADLAVRIGPAESTWSYLDINAVVGAAKSVGANAVHPGYGFLSENAEFARQCTSEGIAFVGPPASAIEQMGSKSAARALMQEAGVPVIPGYHGGDQTDARLAEEARMMGFPVMVKPVMGGGGKGMRIVRRAEDLIDALRSSRSEARLSFGNEHLLLEKYLARSRHIEVQVFADKWGNCVHLWERDCSLQRRHQKIVEEAPAPGLSQSLRGDLGEAAVQAARKVGYESAGTVEFMLDVSDPSHTDHYFLEMNTRLQVEHPVTEEVTGFDLVEWQLRIAEGEELPVTCQADVPCRGHAIEARIYAEDPHNGFLPQAGRLQRFRFPGEPGHLRVDSGVREGDEVSVYYDPMIAKAIKHGPDRESARRGLLQSLQSAEIIGVKTNLDFVNSILLDPTFMQASHDTSTIDGHLDDLLKTPEVLPAADASPVALAAVAYLKHLASQNAAKHPVGSAFGELAGFRVNEPPRAMIFVDGREVSVTQSSLGTWTVALGEELDSEITVHSCTSPGDGEYELDVSTSNLRFRLRSVVCDETLALYACDRSVGAFDIHGTVRSDDFERGKDEHEAVIKAPIPGRIQSVLVKVGDRVSKDDVLVVQEAMKMVHSLKAPRSGIVAHLNATEGDVVGHGHVLLTVGDEVSVAAGGS